MTVPRTQEFFSYPNTYGEYPSNESFSGASTYETVVIITIILNIVQIKFNLVLQV